MEQLALFPHDNESVALSWLPPHIYPEENYLTWGELTACIEGCEEDIVNHVLRRWGSRQELTLYCFALALKARDSERVRKLDPELFKHIPVSVVYQTERSLREIARRWGLL